MSVLADEGWIGRWSPGIGDPSLVGWLTVAAYLVCAVMCYCLVTLHREKLHSGERTLWLVLSVGLLALGINKQLDLQSALTEIGRMLAKQQGWYETRREVQTQFIYVIIFLGCTAGLTLAVLARNAPFPTWVSIAGGIFVIGFVVIRAASFHHFDRMIGSYYLGLKVNWLLELGGLGVILAGVHFRLRCN